MPTLRRCRTGGAQGCQLLDAAMTVDTTDGNGVDVFPVQLAIAVVILGHMAIHAVHAFFEMDVLQVHGHADPCLGCLGGLAYRTTQLLGGDLSKGDPVAERIEEIALPVALENGTEVPAVAMVVSKLGVL